MKDSTFNTYGKLQGTCFAVENGAVAQKKFADFTAYIRRRYCGDRGWDFKWHVLPVDAWYAGIGDTPDIDSDGIDARRAWLHRVYPSKEAAEESIRAQDGIQTEPKKVRLYCASRFGLDYAEHIERIFLFAEEAASHLEKEWKKEIITYAPHVFATRERAQELLRKAA